MTLVDEQTTVGAITSDVERTKRNPPYPKSVTRSIWAARFATFANILATTLLYPNTPFMAAPGASQDSFPSTAPFNFNGATYFIEMCGYLGTAVGSLVIGRLSDRIGRRTCLSLCLAANVFTTIIMYLLRQQFLTFCAASFVNGLFGTSNLLASAHASDLLMTRQEKDTEINIIMAVYMAAVCGGGVVTILMEPTGLFTPLFVGSAFSLIALTVVRWFMIESAPLVMQTLKNTTDVARQDGEEIDGNRPEESAPTGEMSADLAATKSDPSPEKLNVTLFSTVIAASVFDNFGSRGLYPLALSPLAFETFYLDFVSVGEKPLVAANSYRWIQVLLILGVIAGAGLANRLFLYLGKALVFVMGNVFTAAGICGCLYIVGIDPPTKRTLVGFVIFLYTVFPFTVLSQTATMPIMDILAPEHIRGAIHGSYNVVFTFSCAVAPWLLGIIADQAGNAVAFWLCVGFSLIAAMIGGRLMVAPQFQATNRAAVRVDGEANVVVKTGLSEP